MEISWQNSFETGNLLYRGRLFDRAESKYLEALAFARSQGEQSWVGDSLRALARTYLLMEAPESAEKAATEAEAVDRAFWGYENQQVAEDMYLLAEAKHMSGNLAQAREIFDRTLEVRIAVFVNDHDDILAVLIRLMWIDLEEGDSRGTLITNMRQATAMFARLHPQGDFARRLEVPALLKPYLDHEMPSEALLIFERLQKAMRIVLGNTHPEIAGILADCADVLKLANNQLPELRKKPKSDVANKSKTADLWLSQMQASKAIAAARNPATGTGTNLPNTQTGSLPPYPPAQPNQFPSPNPFASGFPVAPPNPSPKATSFPLPDLFSSGSSASEVKPYSQATPDTNQNPFLAADLNSPASPNSADGPVTPQVSETASAQLPAIGYPKIDLSELPKGQNSVQPEPTGSKGESSFASSLRGAAKKIFDWQGRDKNANDLRRELSIFLDLVIMYVDKGVSVALAVQQVSKSSAGSCPTLCRELEKSLINLKSVKDAIPKAFIQVGQESGVIELIELGCTLEAAETSKSSIAYHLHEQSKALKSQLK